MLILAGISTACSDNQGRGTSDYLVADTIPTLSDLKIELTKEYCQQHYGFSGYRLDSPKIVVIHYTVIPTLEETLELFKRDHLASNRTKIQQFSSLNVGIHYVIDKDGTIYNLLPDSIIARHLIGFNHVSLGIENIAVDENDLTEEQLESNIKLVNFLSERHRSIEYLIGHDEYNNRSLPHFDLYTSVDTTYLPHDKPDPGVKFMQNVRLELKARYGLELKD